MILQVVGYKNSGKTTLVAHAVRFFKAQGYPVVTIKHHGHEGEEITLPTNNVDHMKHFTAGADQSIVQGHDFIETIQKNEGIALETLIKDCVTIKNSIILIEGYKHAPYDKIILYRNEAELHALTQLSNVKYRIQRSETDIDYSHVDAVLQTWLSEAKDD
ncbi:molybdopterin-guanine dinucleotide biosynthesis protein B [Staphylococcus agnetis]|uniref:molybdopterin-guanine dinucleotide biosynthesis protein B n=1 Tax=Staphylococcus agnetis TaxID=985762 RepID=UPI000D034FC6|nr:molybdopterin-guanine dinucleotide biosynthesis protein B [Staphylococcus agnetis]